MLKKGVCYDYLKFSFQSVNCFYQIFLDLAFKFKLSFLILAIPFMLLSFHICFLVNYA